MSCNYAEGLSPYENKGKCGLPETFDSEEDFEKSASELTKLIQNAKHAVVYTGAGISTSAGIPDFRGPTGVWTLEQKGEKPVISTSFDSAVPTTTHMALTELANLNYIKYIITQNVDGLHLKSGLPRDKISELHGNMFIAECTYCHRQFVRATAVPTVGRKSLSESCPRSHLTIRRPCRGQLKDNILDWEDELPINDLRLADQHSKKSDLSICLGTSLQILPSANLPLGCKKNNGKLVIVNLQPTKHDAQADLLIHAYVDKVMAYVMKHLGLELPPYAKHKDPTILAQTCDPKNNKIIEWTITNSNSKKEMKATTKRKVSLINKSNSVCQDMVNNLNETLLSELDCKKFLENKRKHLSDDEINNGNSGNNIKNEIVIN